MRNRLLVLPAVAAGLVMVAASVTAAVRPPRDPARPGEPAGTYVTLRVIAADAAGGRIAKTITRAYKIAL